MPNFIQRKTIESTFANIKARVGGATVVVKMPDMECVDAPIVTSVYTVPKGYLFLPERAILRYRSIENATGDVQVFTYQDDGSRSLNSGEPVIGNTEGCVLIAGDLSTNVMNKFLKADDTITISADSGTSDPIAVATDGQLSAHYILTPYIEGVMIKI
jgi:hypothetical protein